MQFGPFWTAASISTADVSCTHSAPNTSPEDVKCGTGSNTQCQLVPKLQSSASSLQFVLSGFPLPSTSYNSLRQVSDGNDFSQTCDSVARQNNTNSAWSLTYLLAEGMLLMFMLNTTAPVVVSPVFYINFNHPVTH